MLGAHVHLSISDALLPDESLVDILSPFKSLQRPHPFYVIFPDRLPRESVLLNLTLL